MKDGGSAAPAASPALSTSQPELARKLYQQARNKVAMIPHLPIDTPGTRVCVFGLTSAAGQASNGRVGVVFGFLLRVGETEIRKKKVAPGRVPVVLDGDAKPTSIRRDNLHKVKVGGL